MRNLSLCHGPHRVFCVILLMFVSLPVRADWSDWWSTPEQKAQAAYEAGEFDKLKSIAPDADWQGVAEHKNEEYEAAAKTFADIATQQQAQGNSEAANRALYNKGVSEVRAGQYEEAVQSFDEVLEQSPDFKDAKHNRDLAQQLIQQQQQQQQQSQDGDGDGDGDDSSSEEGEQQQSDPSGDQSGEQQSSEQSDSEEQSGEESEESGAGSDDDSDASQLDSDAQQMQDEQAARDALEAEAEAGDEESQADVEQSAVDQQNATPMSESEQATEQWLRRIPDDPAGLLRRKLEQSHRSDYPEVRDAQEPW